MDIASLVAKHYTARKAFGLVISFDRSSPEETAALGRATAAYASEQQRTEEFDRLAWLGRNPRIEQ